MAIKIEKKINANQINNYYFPWSLNNMLHDDINLIAIN